MTSPASSEATFRERGYTLFCESLCGNVSSFKELQTLSQREDKFAIGNKVLTHSLSSAEYNNLTGTISGAAVTKNGVQRFPITLEISKEVKQIIALKRENLTAVESNKESNNETLFNFDQQPQDCLVLKGYYGLFSLINDNLLITTDKEKAVSTLAELFSQRQQINADTCPHAQYILGECYEYGISDILPRDTVQAIEYYRLSAAQGLAAAQCELGYCYHTGESIEQDQVTGIRYYQQAADQGYAKAQYYLGLAYYYGQGVVTDTDDPEDYTAAVKWYQLAADQGYAPAQSTLGFCCQVGRGCNLQIAEAEKYFRLAAAQGDEYASAKLGSLHNFLQT